MVNAQRIIDDARVPLSPSPDADCDTGVSILQQRADGLGKVMSRSRINLGLPSDGSFETGQLPGDSV
jgi:hypothetical protein